MKRWNYLVETVSLDHLDKVLGERGLKGWELVTLIAHPQDAMPFSAIFKKPFTETKPTSPGGDYFAPPTREGEQSPEL
jgi:hypothetical protein